MTNRVRGWLKDIIAEPQFVLQLEGDVHLLLNADVVDKGLWGEEGAHQSRTAPNVFIPYPSTPPTDLFRPFLSAESHEKRKAEGKVTHSNQARAGAKQILASDGLQRP